MKYRRESLLVKRAGDPLVFAPWVRRLELDDLVLGAADRVVGVNRRHAVTALLEELRALRLRLALWRGEILERQIAAVDDRRVTCLVGGDIGVIRLRELVFSLLDRFHFGSRIRALGGRRVTSDEAAARQRDSQQANSSTHAPPRAKHLQISLVVFHVREAIAPPHRYLRKDTYEEKP